MNEVCIHLLSLPFCISLINLETNKKKNISHRNRFVFFHFLGWLVSSLPAMLRWKKLLSLKNRTVSIFDFSHIHLFIIQWQSIYRVNFFFVTWYGRKLFFFFFFIIWALVSRVFRQFFFLYNFYLHREDWCLELMLFLLHSYFGHGYRTQL